MNYKTLKLTLMLPLSVVANDNINNQEILTLDLSNIGKYNFQQIEDGLIRSNYNDLIIEISYGTYAIKTHIDDLNDQISNLNIKTMKDYEYDYQLSKLSDELESFELNLEFLESDDTSQAKYGTWTSVNNTCDIALTQRYTSSPSYKSVNLNVKSTYPFPPGPFPPIHPVDIQAFAIFYPVAGQGQVADVDELTGTNISGGYTSAFVNSGITVSGAQIPFKALSTLHDRWWAGLFGCYTKITVEGYIPASY